jgi:WD40 repeat protein
MPHSTQTFRLFVSSTFSDLKEERNALQELVFPKLRKLCEEHGCRFQAIDLRWGVSEEAGLDNKTMQICFEEIDRCKRTTPKPNFLVLLGDRYGWRPLPEMIPADEFEEIEQRITDDTEKTLLHRWYKRDDNNVPPVYILQPREGEYRDYSTWVNQVEIPLHSLLERIIFEMDLNEEQRIKYTRSATEQEIVRGSLSVPDANEHIFCYFRDISNLEKNIIPTTPSDASLSRLFIDMQENGSIDQAARERIYRLKDQLTSALPDNIRNYRVDWKGEENIPITLDHIPQLCADVETDLTRIIKEQIDTSQKLSPLYQEILAHEKFAEERAKFFIGREEILNTIQEYIAGSPIAPLVIYGASGSGKSALMAKAWEEANQEHPETVIISRFIGATPSSTDIRSLLESLCTQIRDVYGDTETPVPSEYNDLVKAFPEWLQKASADRPLLLFIDALDQLSPQNNAHRLLWLPGQLPPHVSIIVSVLDREGPQGDSLKAARDHLPPNALKQLSPMTAKEGSEILDCLLTDARKMLQPEQREDILRKFEKNGLPLYLKLAFEEAKRWRSYDFLPCGGDTLPGLAEDIPGIISDLFSRLEHPANHGLTLVSKALGYLIAAKNGLTEDEMLDVLSLDKEVMNKRSAFWPDTDRLPVILWSRLYFDLEPYVAERSADNTSLISFYHRQLREVAEERYLSGDKKRDAHAHLASYFGSLKNWQKEVPLHYVEDYYKRIPMFRKVAELPHQLAYAEQGDALYKILSNFDFIDAKTAAFGPYEMIEDNNLSSLLSLQYDQIQLAALKRIKEALQLSSHILIQDQSQLRCQLYVRLTTDENCKLESFIDTIQNNKDRLWLRPIASTLDKVGGPVILTLAGRTNPVRAVAVTPDSKQAVSGSDDKTLKVWDLESGRELAVFTGHTDSVRAVVVTPDGKRVISGSNDKTLKVWDLESGRELATLSGHYSWVEKVAIISDGKRIVSASGVTLKVWDLESGRELTTLRGHGSSVRAVAVTPDGKRAVSGSDDKTLKVWDLESGRKLAVLTGHTDSVRAVAVTPDGKWVVSGSEDQTLKVWDLESGQELATLIGHTSSVYSVAVTPDSKRAVSGSEDQTLKVWDLRSCREIATLRGHTDLVEAVVITHDGRHAVSGSNDGTLKVWDLESNPEPAIYRGHTSMVRAVSILPDCKRVVSGSRDNTLKIWDLKSGRELATLSGHTYPVYSVAVTPDGKRAISGSDDKTLKVWDLETEKELATLVGHNGSVNAVAVTPDSKLAVSGSGDKTLKVWHIKSGFELATLKGHTNSVSAAAIMPDGKQIVSGSWDKTLKVWDLESGRELATLIGHTGPINSVAITPNGKLVISGSDDKTLKVWDLESGQELATLLGHSDSVHSVVVTPDGKLAISGSNDKTLKVWNINSGKVITAFLAESIIDSCNFSQDLTTIVVGCRGGRIHFLHPENLEMCIPILTARHSLADNSFSFNCIYCRRQMIIEKSNLGTEMICSQCYKNLKLNQFAFDDLGY